MNEPTIGAYELSTTEGRVYLGEYTQAEALLLRLSFQNIELEPQGIDTEELTTKEKEIFKNIKLVLVIAFCMTIFLYIADTITQ